MRVEYANMGFTNLICKSVKYYCKDTEPLYHSCMYSLVSLLSVTNYLLTLILKLVTIDYFILIILSTNAFVMIEKETCKCKYVNGRVWAPNPGGRSPHHESSQ